MSRQLFFVTLFLSLLLAACTSVEPTPTPTAVTAAMRITAVPPTRTVPPTLTATSTETATGTAVPTQTNIPPTSTNSPEPTPTVPIWVAAGTAVPQPSTIISPENAHQLTELARWGRGVINDVAVSGDGRYIAIATTTGIYIHNTQNLDELLYWIETDRPVDKITFSPDGSLLAAALARESVHIWQIEDGELLTTFPDEAEDLIFSPDGKYLAVVRPRYSYAIHLWQLEGSSRLEAFLDASAIAFVPNQPLYAVAFIKDRSTYISTYNLPEGEVVNTIQIESCEGCFLDEVASLVFSIDGELMIMGKGSELGYGSTSNVELRRSNTGEVVYTIDPIEIHPPLPYLCDSPFVSFEPLPRPFPGLIYLSPDNQQFSVIYTENSGIQTTVKTYRLSDGQLLHSFVEGTNSVAYSPDGTKILTGSKEGRVQEWEATGFNSTASFEGYDPAIVDIAFSPDGQVIATEHRNSVRFRRAVDGVLLSEFPTAVNVTFSPDGKQYALGFADGHIEVFDAMNGNQQYQIAKHTAPVTQLMFLPNNQNLVSMAQDCTMYVWQATDGSYLFPLEDYIADIPEIAESRMRVGSIVVSPDSIQLMGDFNAVSPFGVWLLADGSLSGVFPDDFEVGVHDLVNIPHSDMFAAIGGTHSQVAFSFWEFEDASLVTEWPKPDNGNYYIQDMGFSPDGKVLVSTSNQGTLELWQVDNQQQLMRQSFDTYVHRVDIWFSAQIAFSPDGRYLVTGTSDGLIHIWGVP